MENPATNGTIPGNPTYLWMGEPKQRGTFGIVAICISTLVICVWSTIHFNVPTTRLTLTRGFFTQVLWMVIALLAPEYLLYLAINQWTDVAYLVKKTLVSHPHLAKPGKLTCMSNYVRKIVGSKDVSTQYQPSSIY